MSVLLIRVDLELFVLMYLAHIDVTAQANIYLEELPMLAVNELQLIFLVNLIWNVLTMQFVYKENVDVVQDSSHEILIV